MPASDPSVGVIAFGVFSVDLRSGELWKSGVKVRLQDQPFRLLRLLLEHPGKVVTREELQRQIWPADTFVDFDHGLNNAIKRLREALGDTAETPRYIETLPRRGYRFMAPLRALEPSESAGEAPERPIKARLTSRADEAPAPDAVTSSRPRVSPKIVATAFGLAIIVSGILIFARLAAWPWPRSVSGESSLRIRSIAVLPFSSFSTDPAQAYLADGLTDALITDLARISGMKVASRTTAMRYRDPNTSLSQIARELNVDGIVEGTVQRVGDRVRISAQLIYGPADRLLWANSFEHDGKDTLELQSTVSSEIAHEIEVSVTLADQKSVRHVRQVNPKALEAFLQARIHIDRATKYFRFDKGGQTQRAELQQAYFYLDKAIEQDSTYRPAYLAYFDALDQASLPAPFEFLSKAKAGLIKALQLGDEDMDGHTSMAELFMRYEYDWADAEREYKRGIEVSPSSGYAHFAYSEYLANVGRNTEAAQELTLAQSLSPEHDYHNDHFAVLQRSDRTLEQQRQILEQRSSDNPFVFMIIAKNYGIAGQFKESVDMWERCLTLYGRPDFASVLREAEATGGPRFALEEWMRAVEEDSRQHNDVDVSMAAFTYSSLGNNDRAFAWLDRAVEQRHWCIPFLKRDNVWNTLRSDPRFKNLLRRVGLPP